MEVLLRRKISGAEGCQPGGETVLEEAEQVGLLPLTEIWPSPGLRVSALVGVPVRPGGVLETGERVPVGDLQDGLRQQTNHRLQGTDC